MTFGTTQGGLLYTVNGPLELEPLQFETVIGPVFAPWGTCVVNCVLLLMVKLALTGPWNRTSVIALGAAKWLPVITTVVPTTP